MKLLRVVFLGTSEFAVPALEALVRKGHTVPLVVTRPDRPADRGLKLTPPPVKRAAGALGLPVFQPERIRDPEALERIRAASPEVLVTASFGQILPPALLFLPPLAALNLHASLLPRHRGAAPLHRALLEGDRETGVTVQYMAEGLDEGDILLARAVPLSGRETVGELHDKLAALAADLLLESLDLLAQGRAPRIPQDPTRATYARKIVREDRRLDWTAEAAQEARRVRALSPHPGAETFFAGEPLKVLRAEAVQGEGAPGEVLSVGREGIRAACGRGALLLEEVQPAGKRPMEARAFAAGRPQLKPGARFE